jgi:hypothetical protein
MATNLVAMLIFTTSVWTVVGALGAAIGGLGAAVGGVAAWRAASASRATSRDAMEALGLAIAPSLAGDAGITPIPDGTETCTWHVRIFNLSTQFAASTLHFEARFKDGERVDQALERLAPGEHWELPLRVIGMPPGGPLPNEAEEVATLRYSDEKGILRYETEFGFMGRKNPDGSWTPSVSIIETSNARRI